jgi:hypothetical protein
MHQAQRFKFPGLELAPDRFDEGWSEYAAPAMAGDRLENRATESRIVLEKGEQTKILAVQRGWHARRLAEVDQAAAPVAAVEEPDPLLLHLCLTFAVEFFQLEKFLAVQAANESQDE